MFSTLVERGLGSPWEGGRDFKNFGRLSPQDGLLQKVYGWSSEGRFGLLLDSLALYLGQALNMWARRLIQMLKVEPGATIEEGQEKEQNLLLPESFSTRFF